MKLILTTFCALLIGTAVHSQSPDKALVRVRYTFIHVRDTAQKSNPYQENMLLIAGRNASVYTSYDKIKQSINRKKQIEEQVKNNAGGPQMIKIEGMGKPVTQTDYYFFAAEHKLVTKENLFNNYLVEEQAPVINWKIENDTASFSGILCQKATAVFKGRNWIAWYATELPFQSGPWKLNGLPGLIIEAYDDKKEVQFLFAGTEKVTAENNTVDNPIASAPTLKLPGMDLNTYSGAEITLPADALKTSRKELDKLLAAREKDPQGFMRAQMAASGNNAVINMRGPGKGPGGSPRKTEINNPLELPEKK